MTEALATQNPVPMRIINSPIGPTVPAVDFADNIGYTRSAITNIISKHPDLFKGFILKITLSTPGGDQDFLCLNSTGIDRLIFHLRPIKNRPDLCERVEAFRANAFRQLAEHKKEIPQPPAVPMLDTELQQASRIAELTGTDPRIMQAAALRKCGLKEYADALTPSLLHGEAGVWLNPTQIGARCGHSAREVNNYLEWHRFQYRGPDQLWRLTDKGELHGEEYEFETVSKHIEIRIRWRESIIMASGLIRDRSETLARV